MDTRRPLPAPSPVTALLVALIATGAAAGPATAQETDAPAELAAPRTEVMGFLGLGGGTLDFAALTSLSIARAGTAVVLRAASTEEFTILTSPVESSFDVGVLLAVRGGGTGRWTRLAAGPAVVRTVRRGERRACRSDWFFTSCEYEAEPSTTVGVAVQMDLAWTPVKWLGLGAGLFGNVNGDRSFGGVVVGIHLGQVRPGGAS